MDVDTMTYRARPGDVYLLCSDGLTTMLKDARIAEVLDAGDSLQGAAERLVAEANEAGGRDNITIVAFRLEEAEVAAEGGDGATPPEGATLVGPAAEEAGLTAAGVAAERERRERAGARRRPTPAARRRPRGRTVVKVLAGLLIVGAVVAAAVYGARQVYFLGVDDNDRVALYRGLPYELPLGVELYSEQFAEVPIDTIPPDRQESAIDHELRSKDDAISLLRNLRQVSTDSAASSTG